MLVRLGRSHSLRSSSLHRQSPSLAAPRGWRRSVVRLRRSVQADLHPVRYAELVKLPDLEAEALKLPLAERAHLAEKLLESLEVLPDGESRRLWAEEALRRDAELDADPSRGRPAEAVFRDARARRR